MAYIHKLNNEIVMASTLSSTSSCQSELCKINDCLTSIVIRLDNLEGKQLHDPKPIKPEKRKFVASDNGTESSDSLMDNIDQSGKQYY